MGRTRGEYGRFCRCGEEATRLGKCDRHYHADYKERRVQQDADKSRNQPLDFAGYGVIPCDACGDPLKDHPLSRPCPMSGLA